MKNIKLLGVPFSFGQPHAGVEGALDLLITTGLASRLEEIAPLRDLGSVDFSLVKKESSVAPAVANELISHCIATEDLSRSFLLNIGGDHGMSLGTIHGQLTHAPDTVVVWADAHGDINTPDTTLTGNFHGMPLAFLLGLCDEGNEFNWLRLRLPPERLILIGPRDLDPAEKEIIMRNRIQYYSSDELTLYGPDKLLTQALRKADPEGKLPIHLSFDVDIFDAGDVEATGTRVKEGPDMESVLRIGPCLAETGRLRSMDMVEINPDLSSAQGAFATARLANDFICETLSGAFASQKMSTSIRHSFKAWRALTA